MLTASPGRGGERALFLVVARLGRYYQQLAARVRIPVVAGAGLEGDLAHRATSMATTNTVTQALPPEK